MPQNPEWLATINEVLQKIVQDVFAGKINDITARCNLRTAIIATGYHPKTAQVETQSPEDLLCEARLNLVIKTNVEMAQGERQFIQQNDPAVLEAFPALELTRFENRKIPRDWESRWRIAARAANDSQAARVLESHGRMVALKDSTIWDMLGNSSLFPDGLDKPYPPFAFDSGIWTQDVSYDDTEMLGLVDLSTKVKQHEILPPPSLLPIESERITAYFWNEPTTCDHCGEVKSRRLLSSCNECGETICPDCKMKGCAGPGPPPPPDNAMQCFSIAAEKMMRRELPLAKNLAEQVLQWCNRAFEFGFAAHLRYFEARAHRMRGEALESLGQKEQALREYELAVEKDPQIGVNKSK